MKLAIINDTHHGVRNGSDIFLDYSARFYENTFFPYLLEHGIKKIIHLGDYFEHRKYVNFKVLKHNHKTFISKLLPPSARPEPNLSTFMMDTLLPFQMEGLKFVIARRGRAMIADEMVRSCNLFHN